jgi:hypothetical protein
VTSPEPLRGYQCFASFASIAEAKACLEAISHHNNEGINVKYADVQNDEREEIEHSDDGAFESKMLHAACLTAQECDIPGLELIPEFVTEEEETALLAEVDSLPWDRLARRRVQHYGKVFDYTVRSTSQWVAHSDVVLLCFDLNFYIFSIRH